MRKRDLRALRQSAAESHYYQPGPDEDDADDGEGDRPDGEPLDLWPQELAEQQEKQE